MTEAQAIAKKWREIAVAFYTPRDERTDEQMYIALTGLCGAVHGLYGDEFVTIDVRDDMLEVIALDITELGDSGYRSVNGSEYFCDYNHWMNDILRADYCWMQAEIEESGGV